MTLTVTTFYRDAESGEIIEDGYPQNGEELAGPESWRYSIWHTQAIEYGADILPRLAREDLLIEGVELAVFMAELERLRNSFEDGSVLFRLENMIRATERAIQNGGGVMIG